MSPKPITENLDYIASGRLQNRVVLITGGTSGIGRAIAYLFAKEGADIAAAYLCKDEDAIETKAHIESLGRKCLLIKTDLTKEENCRKAIEKVIDVYHKIDILINNHATQYKSKDLLEISTDQLEKVYKTNVFSYLYLIQNAIPYLKEYSSIINTASVEAFVGSENIDYSSSKGAVVTLTKSLSIPLEKKKIRINAVAPGPTWTNLIPSIYTNEEIETFGTKSPYVPMKRAAQPFEIASSYLFLASDDSRYMTGQILHPNGGTIV